ncbi:hypothetical protein Efla_006523 [Eimeria flavescens]
MVFCSMRPLGSQALAVQRAEASQAFEVATEETSALRGKLNEAPGKKYKQKSQKVCFVDLCHLWNYKLQSLGIQDALLNEVVPFNSRPGENELLGCLFLPRHNESRSADDLRGAFQETHRLFSEAGEHMHSVLRSYKVDASFADKLETAFVAFQSLLTPMFSFKGRNAPSVTVRTARAQDPNAPASDDLRKYSRPGKRLQGASHLRQHANRLQRQLLLCHAQAFLKQRQVKPILQGAVSVDKAANAASRAQVALQLEHVLGSFCVTLVILI